MSLPEWRSLDERPVADSRKASGHGTPFVWKSLAEPGPPEAWTSLREEAPGPTPHRWDPRLVFSAAAAFLLLAGLLAMPPRRDRAPQAARPGNESTPAVGPSGDPARSNPVLEEREDSARQALEEALAYGKSNPGDLGGQIDRYDRIASAWERTAAAREAQKAADALRPRWRSRLEENLAEVDRETAAPEGGEEFGRVVDLLQRARLRHPWNAWRVPIDERIETVKNKAAAHFEVARQRAAEAKDAGDPSEVSRLRARIARWGLEDYVAELDRSLGIAGPVPAEAAAGRPTPVEAKPAFAIPPEPPRSPEGREYVERWEKAMVHAARRDYDAAIAEVRRASRSLVEEDVRREASTDLEDLRRVAALYEDILQGLQRLPRGASVAFECRGDTGGPAKVEGSVIQSDHDRAEVRPTAGRETVFLEYGDVTAVSLAETARKRNIAASKDDRARVLFCLIEGEFEAAKGQLEGRPESVAAKYWIAAREGRARPPKPEPEVFRLERSARELFYAAEREHRSPQTRGLAIEKYRTLYREFAEVPFVRRAIQRITRRGDASQDCYYLASDCRRAGTFQLGRRAAAGACWVSRSDTEFAQAHRNFVELEFYALADTAYRCWVRAGGCCAETFTAYGQVSDLKAPHPYKAGVTVPIEPGSIYGMTLKGPGLPLKAAHSEHASRRDPKEPLQWGWIEILLPRFPSAGIKRVRVVSGQQGFAVARAIVSPARKTPPREADLKELDEARAAEGVVGVDVGPPPAESKTPVKKAQVEKKGGENK